MKVAAHDRMMTEFILDKLSGDGRVELLAVDTTLQFTAKSALKLRAGQKMSVIVSKDVDLNEGDTVHLHITHVVLE